MFLEMYVKKFVLDDNEARELMELIEMKKDLFHRTVDDILHRGLAKGEARGEAKVINSLLSNGYDLDEVCEMVNFEKDYILNLLK